MQDDPSYESYRKFAERIGNTVMDYETWARTSFKLNKNEAPAAALREKWLASDAANVTGLAIRRKKFGANG